MATRQRPTKSQSKKDPTTQSAKPTSTAGVGTHEMLRRLYVSLLRCRLVQEHARDRWPGRYDVAIGQEAMIVGATADINSHDAIVASSRDLTTIVVRRTPLAELLREAGSTCPDGVCGSLPEDAFNRGTAIALAHRLGKNRRVVVALSSDPAPLTSWHDALKVASTHKLPIVYVIKDAAAGSNAPHLEPVSFMARKLGFPGIVVDGQDVVAVWRVAHESILRARAGSGPTLIDCRTDSSRDPLAYMEHYMRKRKAWDQAWKNKTEAEIRGELQRV